MNSTVDKLVMSYPDAKAVVPLPATKATALQRLESISAVIEGMDDFDRFPEGDDGVILYALLKDVSATCPDVGDFNYCRQGYDLFLHAAYEVIAKASRRYKLHDSDGRSGRIARGPPRLVCRLRYPYRGAPDALHCIPLQPPYSRNLYLRDA